MADTPFAPYKRYNDEELRQQAARSQSVGQSVGIAARGAVNDVFGTYAGLSDAAGGVISRLMEGPKAGVNFVRDVGTGFSGVTGPQPTVPADKQAAPAPAKFTNENDAGMAASDKLIKSLENQGRHTSGGGADGAMPLVGSAARIQGAEGRAPLQEPQGGLQAPSHGMYPGMPIMEGGYLPGMQQQAQPQGDTWKDMARQLATFSALRAMDQQPVQQRNFQPDYAKQREAAAQAIHDKYFNSTGMSNISPRTRAQMYAADMQSLSSAYGNDLNYQGHMAGVGVQARGQDLQAATAREGHDVQRRGQDIQKYGYDVNSWDKDRANLNHLLGIQMQGDNQQQLEGMKQKFEQPYKQAQMEHAGAQTGLLNKQIAGYDADREQKYFSDLVTYANGVAKNFGENSPEAKEAIAAIHDYQDRQKAQRARAAAEAKANGKANGGLVQGYAQGGPVAVGGRQVIGAGDGKSDSLPAMIDGERPAALSTGEFVMPVETVKHFGLDRLNKMVAASRKGLDRG